MRDHAHSRLTGRNRAAPCSAPFLSVDDDVADPPPLPPLTPIERRVFDYAALEEAMARLDAVVRQTRHKLGALLRASAS